MFRRVISSCLKIYQSDFLSKYDYNMSYPKNYTYKYIKNQEKSFIYNYLKNYNNNILKNMISNSDYNKFRDIINKSNDTNEKQTTLMLSQKQLPPNKPIIYIVGLVGLALGFKYIYVKL